MKIVFMGSPSFAVPTLYKLVNSEHEVVAVYTRAAKPTGRGQKKLTNTPIYEFAKENNLNIKTPKTLRNIDNQKELAEFKPDFIVVVAYGLILPKEVIDIPKKCALNIHPSDLPKYRGASPITRTILAGETETAICIMKIDTGIDTGDVLVRKKVNLDSKINSEELHKLLFDKGADMILDVINNYNKLIPQKQSEHDISYADKISKNEAYISFAKDDIDIINKKLRALNPIPGTYITYKNENYKIISAQCYPLKHNHIPGEILDKEFSVACINGILKIELIQKPGKKPIKAPELIKTNFFKVGLQF